MGFADDTDSVEDSQKIEYAIITLDGEVYRYTTYDEDIEIDGQTYLAVPFRRGALEVAPSQNPPEMSIEVDAGCAMAVAFASGGMPAQIFTVELYAVEEISGESQLVFAGDVTSASLSGRELRLKIVADVDEPLTAEVPGVYCQSICNHVLFDNRCQAVRDDHLVETTLSSATGQTVVVASMGGNPDHWASGGQIVNLTTGDRRDVLAQIGTTLTLSAPFRIVDALGVGNLVEVERACDHTVETCRDSFDNVINFGGPMAISPGSSSNPFRDGLRGNRLL